MIAAIVLSLMLGGPIFQPATLKKCINACEWDEDENTYVCGYWERRECRRKEIECKDFPAAVCENNTETIGTWGNGDGIREFRWNIPQSYPSPGSESTTSMESK